LADPAHQAKTQKTLEKVCNIFSLFGDNERYESCKQKIDEWILNTMSGAVDTFEPTKFCQEIHVCAANPVHDKRSLIDFSGIRQRACDTCHSFVGKVDAMLADPANQDKARKTMEKVCSIFSLFGDDTRYNECVQKIDDAVNNVATGAANGLEPNKFCQQIHVCAAASVEKRFIDFSGIRQKMCDSCHNVVGKVDSMLADPANQQKARNVLEKVCNIFSVFGDDSRYTACIQKIDLAVINALTGAADSFEPDHFCQQIHVCAATPVNKRFIDFGGIRQKACDACHNFIGRVDDLLADPANQQKARATLERVCSVFNLFGDDTRYTQCIQKIDDAVDQAMLGATSSLEPGKFCQQIHICEGA